MSSEEKLQRKGVFRDMKRAAFYEKPSEKAAREKSEAIRRLASWLGNKLFGKD